MQNQLEEKPFLTGTWVANPTPGKLYQFCEGVFCPQCDHDGTRLNKHHQPSINIPGGAVVLHLRCVAETGIFGGCSVMLFADKLVLVPLEFLVEL